ncbi:MAG: hypothetical protein AAGI01_05125 [Myxococcota bacterium]
MNPLWTWSSPYPVEATVERAQACVKRAWPGSPGNAFWGMRGGYVQPLPERTLALRVASQQLEITCSTKDLEDPEIRSKLARITQTLAAEFDLSPDDVAALRAAANVTPSEGEAGATVHVLEVDLPEDDEHSDVLSDEVHALASALRAQHRRIAGLEATLRALGAERLLRDAAAPVAEAVRGALLETKRGAQAASVTLELEIGAPLEPDGLERLLGPDESARGDLGKVRVTVRMEGLD